MCKSATNVEKYMQLLQLPRTIPLELVFLNKANSPSDKIHPVGSPFYSGQSTHQSDRGGGVVERGGREERQRDIDQTQRQAMGVVVGGGLCKWI